MIDQAKLDALPLETLQMLAQRVKDTIHRKSRQELRYGGQATFWSSKRGREVRIQITGFGPKNAMGLEVDAKGNLTQSKWRVHPSFLTPVAPMRRADQPTSMVAAF